MSKKDVILAAALLTIGVMGYKLKTKPVINQQPRPAQVNVLQTPPRGPFDDSVDWMEDPRYQGAIKQRTSPDKQLVAPLQQAVAQVGQQVQQLLPSVGQVLTPSGQLATLAPARAVSHAKDDDDWLAGPSKPMVGMTRSY